MLWAVIGSEKAAGGGGGRKGGRKTMKIGKIVEERERESEEKEGKVEG